VVGIGVLVETEVPEHKLVPEYESLVVLEQVDDQARRVLVRPSKWVQSLAQSGQA
jgi:purine operon repressor